MSRKAAREHIFKILYGLPFGQEDVTILTDSYVRDFLEEPVDAEDMDFIRTETRGVQENQERLDEEIGAALKGWKVNRLSKVDLAILRLAAYEILFVEELPIKVSINEAVELAKKYSMETAPSFINGILGSIAVKGIEKDEKL